LLLQWVVSDPQGRNLINRVSLKIEARASQIHD
jgi:hypothetical protein